MNGMLLLALVATTAQPTTTIPNYALTLTLPFHAAQVLSDAKTGEERLDATLTFKLPAVPRYRDKGENHKRRGYREYRDYNKTSQFAI